MIATADRLKQHAFEEDELFPAIELAVRDALAAVQLAPRDRARSPAP